MNRFYLRSISTGFKVPGMNLESCSGTEDFIRNLLNSYLGWFDVIESDLPLINYDNEDILMYWSILRVDSISQTKLTIRDGLNKLKYNIAKIFKDYLDLNNQSYTELKLESMTIGFECPFLSGNLDDLNSNITNLIKFPFLRNNLRVVELPNLNSALIYDITSDASNLDKMKSLEDKISDMMQDYLNSNHLLNQKFN